MRKSRRCSENQRQAWANCSANFGTKSGSSLVIDIRGFIAPSKRVQTAFPNRWTVTVLTRKAGIYELLRVLKTG
jgi:hypothetical protein